MNRSLIKALNVVIKEAYRAKDNVQMDEPVRHQLHDALSVLDEELSSESYRQRVLAAELAARDRAGSYTAEEKALGEMALAAHADRAVQRRLDSLERLNNAARKLGFIDAEGNVTPLLEELTGIGLRSTPIGTQINFTKDVYKPGQP